jgi:hypothetical protein
MTIAFGLVACASSKAVNPQPVVFSSVAGKAAAQKDNKDQAKHLCAWERPTGTNIPQLVCRTPEEIDTDRNDAQDWLRRQPSVEKAKGN